MTNSPPPPRKRTPSPKAGNDSGWHVDTLHEHIERIFAEHEVRYDQRFTGIIEAQRKAEEAVDTALHTQERLVQRAEEVNDRRFEAFTAARRSTDAATLLMMPRTEAEQRFSALDAKMQQLHNASNDKWAELSARFDRTEGRGHGLNAGWGYLVGAIGAVGGVLAIVFALTR